MLFRATTKLDMANGHSVVTMWSAVSQVIDLSTLQRDIRPAVATNNFSMTVVMGPFQFFILIPFDDVTISNYTTRPLRCVPSLFLYGTP